MPYQFKVCGLSDTGLVRPNNEDYWAQMPERNLYVLADGMGGHRAGEIASREAVTILCQLIKQNERIFLKGSKVRDIEVFLKESFQQVNSRIFSLGSQQEHWKGMGTTLCCLHMHQQGIIYCYVGDSRIYRLRDGCLDQLTRDHSLLQELIELGQVKEDHASGFLYRNILTKAVGTEPLVSPSTGSLDIMPHDLYLMCTDGLTDLLSKKDIESILNSTGNLQEAANKLVKQAKENGGYDNITVILVHCQAI